jgi:glyoxylase-like metal-dependent hydrolase (beta-lactamase superfamily II)
MQGRCRSTLNSPIMGRLAEVAPGVLMATSRRDQTTSTVVTAPRSRRNRDAPVLLVDPAWEPDELTALALDLSDRRLVPTAGLSTHAHYDHLLWHPRFGKRPRWSSPETARRARQELASTLELLGPDWPAELVELVGDVCPTSSRLLPWSGPDVELIVHDAHQPGHTAAWVADRRLLIAGDMLSDVELPLPDDGPDALARYTAGLDRLAGYVERAELLIPGHGAPTTDASSRLAADRAYLNDVLARQSTADPRLANPGMADAHCVTMSLPV